MLAEEPSYFVAHPYSSHQLGLTDLFSSIVTDGSGRSKKKKNKYATDFLFYDQLDFILFPPGIILSYYPDKNSWYRPDQFNLAPSFPRPRFMFPSSGDCVCAIRQSAVQKVNKKQTKVDKS